MTLRTHKAVSWASPWQVYALGVTWLPGYSLLDVILCHPLGPLMQRVSPQLCQHAGCSEEYTISESLMKSRRVVKIHTNTCTQAHTQEYDDMIDTHWFVGYACVCFSVCACVNVCLCVSHRSRRFNYSGCIKSSFPQPSQSARLMVNTDEYCIFTINSQCVCQRGEEINAESLRERNEGSWRHPYRAEKWSAGKKKKRNWIICIII